MVGISLIDSLGKHPKKAGIFPSGALLGKHMLEKALRGNGDVTGIYTGLSNY